MKRSKAIMRRYAYSLLLGLAVYIALLVTASSQSTAFEEDTIKAAFLHYFFQLIRWPADTNEENFHFCTTGDSHVTSQLQELVALRRTANRAISFSLISTPKEATSCDYVFISSDTKELALPIIHTTREQAILTVSDTAGFADAGGVIELKRESTRIKVRINTEALSAQSLQASSKLLSVSERVTTRGKQT